MKRAFYSRHVYSASKKSKNSEAAFKRWHNSEDIGDTSQRSKIWRKMENKENEPSSETSEDPTPGPNCYGPSKRVPLETLPTPSSVENVNLQPSSAPVNVIWPSTPGVEQHELCIEIDPASRQHIVGINGYRLVDINHILEWTLAMQRDHDRVCTMNRIELVSEKRDGFRSTFLFRCTTCEKEFTQYSEAHEKVNKAFVWGTLTGGSYYAQTNHLLSSLDVPAMTPKKFRKAEHDLGTVFEDHLLEEMKEAGKREREIAIEKGHVGEDGIPYIMVFVDGGWSKRSYGHNFNASSGTACIIGAETKKCLFIGVRNKYCSVCSYSNKTGTEKEHVCFKNYTGSSTGMETEILVEGFCKSEEMHGVKYTSFVGDGDSSVFARLRQKVPYGRNIKKMECKNHVIKNYTSSLYKIATDTKMPLEARKIVSAHIQKLTTVARMHMTHCKSDVQKMRRDLQNGPYHVFGDHDKCESYYCRYVREGNNDERDENLIPTLKNHVLLWARIETAIDNICRKADRLTANVTNNVAENFMSIMAKFNCGKRLNLTQRGSYTRRVHIAGLHQISGKTWQTKAWKKASNHLPGTHYQRYLIRQQKIAEMRKRIVRPKTFSKEKGTAAVQRALPDKDYGPAAADVPVEMPEDELKELCEKKLKEFQVEDLEIIEDIQRKTIGQHGNEIFDELRKDRLTASQFGMICKRRTGNLCHNHVKAVLYKSNFSNADTAYGQTYEKVAIRQFELATNKTVIPCGLFIDPEHGFLGASPDGIVLGESSLVEVKTFPSLSRIGQSLEDAAGNKKSFCLKLGPDGDLQLKENHNFYYQIQGQIHVARKERCYLILFVDNKKPINVLTVERNESFVSQMVKKLSTFYVDCILPEIILRRVPNNHKCREPIPTESSST